MFEEDGKPRKTSAEYVKAVERKCSREILKGKIEEEFMVTRKRSSSIYEKRNKIEKEERLRLYEKWFKNLPNIRDTIQMNLEFTYTCMKCKLPQLPDKKLGEYCNRCDICGEQVPCDDFCVSVMGELGMEECKKCQRKIIGPCCSDACFNTCSKCS